MLKKALITTTVLTFPLTAFAVEASFVSPYEHNKSEVIAKMDRCELIGASEIIKINAYTIAELREQFKSTQKFIEETRAKRGKCYASAIEELNTLVNEGYEFLSRNSNNLIFQRQHEVDQSLMPILNLRMNISDQLLESTLNDIEISVQSPLDDEEASSTFYTESSRTRSLVRQDMAVVMEAQRRQMALDELKLIDNELILQEYAPHKLNEIQFNLSQSLAAFEEAYTHDNPAFIIARIKAKVSSATENINELLTYMVPFKKELPEKVKTISGLYNDARIMSVDLSGTLNDLNAGIYSGNLENWLGSLYQQINDLTNRTQDIYGAHLKERSVWRAKQQEKRFAEEKKAEELSKEMAQQIAPWQEDFIEPQKQNLEVQDTPITMFPQIEEENLLKAEEEKKATEPAYKIELPKIEEQVQPTAKEQKAEEAPTEKPKRLTPDASFTDLLKRKLEETRRKENDPVNRF